MCSLRFLARLLKGKIKTHVSTKIEEDIHKYNNSHSLIYMNDITPLVCPLTLTLTFF